jgi:hypothetical protein
LELTKYEQYGFTPGTPTDQEVKHVESTDDLVLSGPAYLDETGSAYTDAETGERWVLCWVRMPNTEHGKTLLETYKETGTLTGD